MRNPMNRRRRGFTIAEVLIALTLFGALTAVTLQVISREIHAFNNGSAQADAAQHLRFSMTVLERHVSSVGAGVPEIQPQFVYGDSMLIAFNADWMSNLAGDVNAVNVDTMAPNLWVTSLTKARRFTLPGTSFAYPDTTYVTGGLQSPAETIIFWFALDASTAATNDYILWRQVNDRPAEMVARNLLRPTSGRFFKYYRHITPVSGQTRLDSIPSSWLPLRHVRPIHGAIDDTASFMRIDSVRAIEVSFRTTDALPAPNTRTFSIRRMINLPNAGKEVQKTCGDEPIMQTGTNFTLTDTTDTAVPPNHTILLRWLPSVDEASGEKDVTGYVLWRSTASLNVSNLGDPWLSVPAGFSSYEHRDEGVVAGGPTYYYAIAAQDCTPLLSNIIFRNITP